MKRSKMTEAEKLVCDFAYKFTNDNWGKINKEKCGITRSKANLLAEINTDPQTALWIIMEVSNWDMIGREYLREIRVDFTEDCDFPVLKIDEKYLKLELQEDYSWSVSFVEPKFKKIMYFE